MIRNMNTQPVRVSLFFCILFCVAAFGADLESLEKQFELRLSSEVELPHGVAVATLNQKYLLALDRALDGAKKLGHLEESLSIKSERDRISDSKGVPATNAGNDPDSLKSLRSTYKLSLSALELERDKRMQPLIAIYCKSLDELVTALTREGNLDAAKKASERRRELSAKQQSKVASPKGTRRIRFQASVPATAHIAIENGKLWIEDHSASDYTTNIRINGRSWKPTWADNRFSEKYDLSSEIALIGDVKVAVHKTSGRGNVEVVEQPSVANGQRTAVDISDPQPGSGDYDIAITW